MFQPEYAGKLKPGENWRLGGLVHSTVSVLSAACRQPVGHLLAGEKADVAVGSAAAVVVRAHFLEAGLWVGHAGCCALLHETFGEEGPPTMMFVDFQQAGRPVVRCSSGPVRFRRPTLHIGAKSAPKWAKRGCAHCAHYCRRTGSYIGRIGPDSACFPGIPMIARAGMQFESHLGHA